jgi:serine protease Do
MENVTSIQKVKLLNNHRVTMSVGAVLILVVGIVLGAAVASRSSWSAAGQNKSNGSSPLAVSAPGGGSISLSEGLGPVVRAVRESVVSIETKTKVQPRGGDFFDDPLFRRFFGEPRRPRDFTQEGLGSGVIVSPDGYVLTNNHVVENATELTVILSDQREFKGKVVGADPKSDVAVVKIEATKLPVAPIGDSSRVQVGDFVVAIGSPFDPRLQQTVTFGIVSATGRGNLGIASYGDFIQTDAAINPGNSGGALINMRGELIGINTAIFSRGIAANAGVGFSIPIKMARDVMDRILKDGKVVRGFLGVNIQTLTDAMAEVYGIKDRRGAIVVEVVADSPAERAGLRRDDVIVEFNGQKVNDRDQLSNMVGLTAPGTKVTLKVLRDGKEQTLTAELEELKEERAANRFGGREIERGNTLSGIDVEDLTPSAQRRYELPRSVTGVVVADVADDSPAAEAGLSPGDIIQEVNRQIVRTVEDFRRATSSVGNRRAVLRVYVQRQQASILMVIEPRG